MKNLRFPLPCRYHEHHVCLGSPTLSVPWGNAERPGGCCTCGGFESQLGKSHFRKSQSIIRELIAILPKLTEAESGMMVVRGLGGEGSKEIVV